MYFRCAILIYLMLAGMIFAQNHSKSSVNISASIISGSMFNIVKSNLDISESAGCAKGKFILQSIGGFSLRSDNLDCGSNSSDRSTSEIQLSTTNNKIEKTFINNLDKLNLQPLIRKTNEIINKDATKKIELSSVVFKRNTNNSLSNILVGSSLQLFDTSEQNLYSGIFVVSLIY